MEEMGDEECHEEPLHLNLPLGFRHVRSSFPSKVTQKLLIGSGKRKKMPGHARGREGLPSFKAKICIEQLIGEASYRPMIEEMR